MSARSTPYPSAGYYVRIPHQIWRFALDEVRRYASLGTHEGRRGSEGLVYLGGVPTPDALIVTSLLRLQHEPLGDRVQPTPTEVRWLLSTLRNRDEKLVAQLHTHRYGGHHSPGDDAMATSFHDGFLSIVVPRFAAGVDRLDQCIVHEYRDGVFVALSTEDTTKRFTVHSQIVDHCPAKSKEEMSRWRRFVRSLKSIAQQQH